MRTGRSRAALLAAAPLMVLALMMGSCSSDKDPVSPGDTTAPAAIALAVGSVTNTSVELTWSAPGDDGTSGTARQYDVRYSITAITPANFAAAAAVTGEPTPTAYGTSQSVTVSGLTPNTPYFFALKTGDEVPNWSGISNVAQATTTQSTDVTPPAAITIFNAVAADSTDVLLTWTATGDDGSTGTAHLYDIRFATADITDANWPAATQVSGEPTPAAAGTVQSMHVTGLNPGTDYFFAMKASDEASNASALSDVATAHTPTGPSDPPMLTAVDLPDSVCISSADQYAQMAKMMATGQLALASAYMNLGSAFFAPLGSAEWQQTGDCWDYEYDLGSCSVNYYACLTGSDYEYTLTYDGPCFGENYTDWVAYRANFDSASRTGTFLTYEPNTTVVAVAWIWTEAADGLSGDYTFYEGDPSTAPVQSIIEWTESADGNTTQVTFIDPDQAKWVSTFHKTPCSGTFTQYEWDDTGGPWWMETDIAWNGDGTGYYRIYDDSGELLEEHLW